MADNLTHYAYKGPPINTPKQRGLENFQDGEHIHVLVGSRTLTPWGQRLLISSYVPLYLAVDFHLL